MKLAVFNTLVLRWCFWLLEMSLSVQSRLLPDQHTRMFSMCPKGTEFKAKHKVVKVGLRPFMSHGLVFPLANSNSSCFPLPPWAFLTFPPPTFAPRLSLTFHPSLPPSLPRLLLLGRVRFSPLQLLRSVKSSRCPGFSLWDSLCQPCSSSSPVSTLGLAQCRENWVDNRIKCYFWKGLTHPHW